MTWRAERQVAQLAPYRGAQRTSHLLEYRGKRKKKKYTPFVPTPNIQAPVETVDPCVNSFIEEFEENRDRLVIEMKVRATIRELNGFLAHIEQLPLPPESETESVPSSDGVKSS